MASQPGSGSIGLWGSQSWLRAGFVAGLDALKARPQAQLPAPQAKLTHEKCNEKSAPVGAAYNRRIMRANAPARSDPRRGARQSARAERSARHKFPQPEKPGHRAGLGT